MNAIDCLGRRERRACTFIVRMFFHDAGAIDQSKNPFSGSDASVVLNNGETILPPSTQHGEAVMDRYTLGKLAAQFGMSYADGLSVAAAQCTQTFGSYINIPQVCSAAGLPLKVGKLDNTNVDVNSVKDKLPGGFDKADLWITFWRNYLNSRIYAGPQWTFNVDEAVAMMGSHVLLDQHGCTQGPGGVQRNRQWNNAYFKDMLSGRVEVRGTSAANAYHIAVNGFTLTTTNGCEFDTSGFKRKTQNAQYEVKAAQHAAGISSPSEPNLDTFWWPDQNTRAVCTGGSDNQCAPCGWWDFRKFCTSGHVIGEAFWPYTVNDGFLAIAARSTSQSPYCLWGGCTTSYKGIENDLLAVAAAFRTFRDSEDAWLRKYAIGHCKLSNLDARYSVGSGIDLNTFTGGYKGTCAAATPAIVNIVNDIVGEPPCDVSDPFPAAPATTCFLGIFC